MKAVIFDKVSIVFGPRPQDALPLMDKGQDRAAIQQATGQVRLYDNEIAHARRLAVAGYTAADVSAATLNVCDAAIERRAGVPSLYDVASGML